MGDVVLKVEGLSKRFVISHHGTKVYRSLRDEVLNFSKNIFKGTSGKAKAIEREDFWAVNDVSFDVKKGDRVGIIGRNGAGKSTLLKILSRITEPTKGRATIDGRVASLLEVGTGFHPELTGRENIFLNGAILGMTRAEIRKKFDEIVSFAEVEQFLDMPVKKYSSGMYVRLAFSVAAHLEPEILIVDEVLAVGDAQFQKKCLGKLEGVSKNDGRTIIFVSHQMGTVSRLCNRGILLNKGCLVINDTIDNAIERYLGDNVRSGLGIEKQITDAGTPQFTRVFMTDDIGDLRSDYLYDEKIVIRVKMFLPDFHDSFELAMRLVDKHERAIFTIHDKLSTHYEGNPVIEINIEVPGNFITPGKYSWVMCINHPGVNIFDLHENTIAFSVLESGSEFARYEGSDYGSVFAKYKVNKVIPIKA